MWLCVSDLATHVGVHYCSLLDLFAASSFARAYCDMHKN